MCMKEANASKLAAPRERGAPRTDNDPICNVPLTTSRCSAFPGQSGLRGDDRKGVALWRKSAVISDGSPAMGEWLAK